jgi:hypothetical protein
MKNSKRHIMMPVWSKTRRRELGPPSASFVKGRRRNRRDRDVTQRFHTMKTLNSICPTLFGLGRLAILMALAVMTLGACTKKAEPPPMVRPVRSDRC